MKGCIRLLSGMLAAGLLFFLAGYAAAGRTWASHPGNRHAYGSYGMPAGGTVTDRNGTLLADYSGNRSCTDPCLRKSTVHWVGDRQGNIPIPAIRSKLDPIAHWDPINGLYRYPQEPETVKLTLDGELQKIASKAMEGRTGVVCVYNYRTGEVLCALSAPGYDPENPEVTQGMYWNRFTQASFVPGSVFKLVTTAAALEEWGDLDAWGYDCRGKAGEVTCPCAHGPQNLQQALANSCNCAYAALAKELGPERLEQYTKQFRVLEPVSLDGWKTAGGQAHFSRISEDDLAWAAIGQHEDLIDPCAFLAFLGAIAGNGRGAVPHILPGEPVQGPRILSPATAQQLQKLMAGNVKTNYGTRHFPGMQVCAKTGTAQLGPGKAPNALLGGFVLDPEKPYAFLVIVQEAGAGKTVCIPIAAALLQALKQNPPA